MKFIVPILQDDGMFIAQFLEALDRQSKTRMS